MTRLISVLFLAVSIVVLATPAGAPAPTVDDIIQQQINKRAMELIRQSAAKSRMLPALTTTESDAVKQAVANAMAAKQTPASAILSPQPPAPPPVVTAPPPPVVVTAQTQVNIPAELRDSIVSLCSLLITAGVAAGLAWMRTHFAFMKEVGANQAITSSANGLGALLEQELAKQGKSLSSVSISDPNVAAAAQKLLAAYPQWGPLVGLTQDIAERKVLGGALQQSSAPVSPAAPPATPPAPTPPPPAPPPVVVSPTPAAVTVIAEAVPVVPTPPMDLEVHP